MKAVPLREAETEVLARVASAERVFCFLDYDGTLSPLAPTPDAAEPLPGVPALLRALACGPGILVALVSGRPIAELRRIVDIEGAYYVGIHGLETQRPGGAIEGSQGAALVRSVLPSIRQQLESALAGLDGVLFEDKGAALGVHYRLASRADAAKARWTVAAIARGYQARGVKIAVRDGHEVSEIQPVFASKAKAVRALLSMQGRGVLPVCIGDDRTDEDVFAAIAPPAVTIRVGGADVTTAARFRLAGPQEVLEFLRDVLRSRSA